MVRKIAGAFRAVTLGAKDCVIDRSWGVKG